MTVKIRLLKTNSRRGLTLTSESVGFESVNLLTVGIDLSLIIDQGLESYTVNEKNITYFTNILKKFFLYIKEMLPNFTFFMTWNTCQA